MHLSTKLLFWLLLVNLTIGSSPAESYLVWRRSCLPIRARFGRSIFVRVACRRVLVDLRPNYAAQPRPVQPTRPELLASTTTRQPMTRQPDVPSTMSTTLPTTPTTTTTTTSMASTAAYSEPTAATTLAVTNFASAELPKLTSEVTFSTAETATQPTGALTSSPTTDFVTSDSTTQMPVSETTPVDGAENIPSAAARSVSASVYEENLEPL